MNSAVHHSRFGAPASVDWTSWTERIDSQITESLLDRLINTSHQVFMNGPSYRPNKRPRGNHEPKTQNKEVG